jgi:micrococcal nuclease
MKLIILITQIILISCLANAVKVKRVIDGDTFETDSGEKVRLIGINSPEISDVYGVESKNYLIKLISGKTIVLLSDVKSHDRDRYNRLLRYVDLNGVDINKKMILEGYAFAYLKFQFSRFIEYRKSQFFAMEYGKGIWGLQKHEENLSNQNVKSGHFLEPKEIFISLVLIILIIFMLFHIFRK